MSENLSELLGRKGVDRSLFDKMGRLAKPEGRVPEDELAQLADDFLIGKANVFGTASFYDFLKPENQGKEAYVCNGTACLCAGTQDKVKEELLGYYTEDQIGHMTCLGRCHENAAFNIGDRNYSGTDIEKLSDITENTYPRSAENYQVYAHSQAILTRETGGIEDFYRPWVKALERGPEEILEEIKVSGLRGRGGAGFPMAQKLAFCKNTSGDVKFIICNADEGDPGAYSDRYLLEERPHSVLFGMLISGLITGASHGILYIRAEYPQSAINIQHAIDELMELNLAGDNIRNSGFNFHFKIIRAQGSYICGEETALINSIEGQRPEVRVRPPYPAQRGLFNKPTVVNNVETLAALHYIISDGGSAWKELGTESSSGTKLVCLDGLFNRPGLYEVEMGTPLSVLINELGQGFRKPVKAMQIGGPLGGIVPLSRIDDLSLDFESFSKAGFLLGHASVVSIPEDFPMIKFIEHLFDFAAYESCGKCFPCRLGTKRGHELARGAINGEHKIDSQLFNDLLTTLEKGSLCAHGGGIPLPVRNALQYFDDELKNYFKN